MKEAIVFSPDVDTSGLGLDGLDAGVGRLAFEAVGEALESSAFATVTTSQFPVTVTAGHGYCTLIYG